MSRQLVTCALFCALALTPIARAQHSSGSNGGHSSSHSSKSSTHSSKSKSKSGGGTAHAGSYRKNYMAEGFTPHASVTRDRHGRIKRSRAAKSAFEHQNPCPSTGKNSGACRGYIVDHKRALECGGADSPSNMQWQTVAAAKAKDKTEGACRQ
jgi:hypothetical protein